MFSLVSGLYAEYFSPQQINLLVVGVQGSGKTTILERIKVTHFATQSVAISSSSIMNKNSTSTIVLDDTAIAAAAAAAAVTAAQSSKEYKNNNTKNQSDHHHHHTNPNNLTHRGVSSHRSSQNNNTIGPSPEPLRSKIFLSDNIDDYQAPKRRRTKHNNTSHNCTATTVTSSNSSSSSSSSHISRFGWICPPPPKFIFPLHTTTNNNTRMDTSDRGSDSNLRYTYNNDDDDDEFSNDGFDIDNAAENNNNSHPFWDPEDDIDDETDRNDDDDNDDNGTAMDTTLLSTTSTASARSRRNVATTTTTLAAANTLSNSKTKSGTTSSSSHHNNNSNHHGGPLGLPAPRRINSNTSTNPNGSDDLRKSSMESIDLNDRQRYYSSQQQGLPQRSFLGNVDDDDTDDMLKLERKMQMQQYDIKPNCKMLPLEKIRPTIGMNLSKNEICGAKVHVWDLGGKLQDLWERYYDDADAVLFVWRLNRQDVIAQQQQQQRQSSSGNHSSTTVDRDMEDVVRVTAEQQMKVLEHVRSSVPDDIPFCLLGNLFQVQPPYNCETDVLYSTDHLLPHYHNPLQALFMANAVSGQGIKSAIEWLISTAKRQQRIRKRLIAT